MDRQPVNSSMIVSIGYEAESGTLEIEYQKGGGIWQYYDFPEHMWNEFQYCESHGKYWHANIKTRFREARVG